MHICVYVSIDVNLLIFIFIRVKFAYTLGWNYFGSSISKSVGRFGKHTSCSEMPSSGLPLCWLILNCELWDDWKVDKQWRFEFWMHMEGIGNRGYGSSDGLTSLTFSLVSIGYISISTGTKKEQSLPINSAVRVNPGRWMGPERKQDKPYYRSDYTSIRPYMHA